MTRQGKINHLKKNGYKVTFSMVSGDLWIEGNGYNRAFKSVNEAHRYIYGY